MISKFNKKIILYLSGIFLLFALVFVFLTGFADLSFASETDGTISSTYKYAWGENIGWINFGTSNGDVHITDSGLSGYALGENTGWIYLGDVSNDGEGNLSGHAWGENIGWIKFNPTNGGVIINSSGEFTGSALGENTGWIIFDCGTTACVKTDWRPGSVRPTEDLTVKVPGQLAPPSRPEEGFRFLINGGASKTESPIVTLEIFGGPDTIFVEISNFPDFRKSIKESYQKFKTWNLCQGKIICLGGKYTVYVKFFTSWETSSEVLSASIIYRRPILEIPEIIKKITEIFKPKPPEEVKPPEIPIEELVPKEAPSVFQGQWPLLTYTLQNEPFVKFTLAPLPKEFQKLAEKFPELEKTFTEVGVQRLIDIEKLGPVKLTLPGLTERIGLPTTKIEPGKFALPQGVPVAELSAGVKERIPSEIVFVKTGGKLIDFSIALSVTEKGKTEQRIATISGKPLQLIVKPDQPVKSIKGYVVFKSTPEKVTELEIPLESLLASVFFSNPIFTREHNSKEIEEVLVLMEFEYTDPDGDGIYTADIQAPLVEGEYEIITVMDYEDPELGQKEIRLIAVVDPEGYVYEKAGGKETRIPGAIVSLFWLNPETKQYELWPAEEYHQENPQATDVTGKYSFLVPPSLYYLKVEAPGYLPDEGKPFQVQEGSGIHLNIELKTKFWYLKIFDWKTILLILVIFLLFYNFYRDKIRERKTINL